MKNSVLASALATAALAGCMETIPVKQGAADAAPQDNKPRAMAVTPTAAAPVAAAAGSIKWNDEECATKNLTLGTATNTVAGSNNACVRVVLSGTPTAAETVQPKSTQRRNATSAKSAPAAAPVVAGPAPDAIILSARLSLSECGATSGNALQTASDVGKNLLGTLGGLFGNRASQTASTAVGGGIVGGVAGRAAKDATGAATTQGTTTAKGAAAPLTEAGAKCNAQLTALSKGAFTDGINYFLTDWKATNKGYTPVLTLTSDLPAAHEAILKSVLAAPTLEKR